MSTAEKPAGNTGATMAEDVAAYLREHPGFFDEHPDLLVELSVPHASGDAISLVEKQVASLREQNERLSKRLHEVIEIAKQNEDLARRMHQLVLTLMDAAEPKEIFSTLYENLRRNFKADKVSVRLFARPAFIDSYAGVEFAGPDVEEAGLFRSVIAKRQPICGRLKRQQQVFLFGDDGDEIRSAVMVPLHAPEWGGIMAIGSKDTDRFQEGMGVELLAHLGENLSFILKPWLETR